MTRKEERKQVAKDTFPNEGWEFQRVSFIQGAEWADKTMIERACKWLENNVEDYEAFDPIDGVYYQDIYALISDFKKAMEE